MFVGVLPAYMVQSQLLYDHHQMHHYCTICHHIARMGRRVLVLNPIPVDISSCVHPYILVSLYGPGWDKSFLHNHNDYNVAAAILIRTAKKIF